MIGMRKFLLTFVLTLFCVGCLAQETEQGLRPYGPYVKSGIAQINLQNGNAYGEIPLVTYQQKGKLAPLSVFLKFNTTTFEQVETCPPLTGECFTYYVTSGEVAGGDSPGVHLDYSYLGESVSESHLKIQSLIQDPGGMAGALEEWEHAHYLKDQTGQQHTMVLSTDRTRYDAADGSGYAEILSFPLPIARIGPQPTSTIVYPDGTTRDLAGKATDVLGNVIQWVTRVAQSGPLAGQQEYFLVDSVGREIHTYQGDLHLCPNLGVSGQSPTQAAELELPGPNGTTASYLLCGETVHYHTNFIGWSTDDFKDTWAWPAMLSDPPCYDPENCGITTTAVNSIGQFDALQAVVLPDSSGHVSTQSKYWGFIYDSSVPLVNGQGQTYSSESYGTLSKIIYPTGATDSMTYASSNVQVGAINEYGAMPPAYRSVTALVRDDGDGHLQPTTFDYAGLHVPFAHSWTNVRDGLGNVTEHLLSGQGVSGILDSGSERVYETDTLVHSGDLSGPVVSRTHNAYSVDSSCAGHVFTLGSYCAVLPSSRSTYDDAELISTTSYSYPTLSTGIDLIYNSYLAYGEVEPPFRIPFGQPDTITTSDAGGAVLRTETTRYRFLDNAATKLANILSLTSSKSVLDGSGAVVSSTTFGFDEVGSPQGTFGNQTSVHKLTASGGEIVTRQVFNGDGMPILITDANDNKTSITYDCQGMYPSAVIKAYQSPTTVSETITYRHDCGTGDLIEFVDPNGVKSQFAYNDVFDRPTGSTKGVGIPGVEAKLTISYPTLTQVEIRADQNSNGDGLLQSSLTYDGLGREVQRKKTNGAIVSTEYDANGNVSSVSDPHMPADAPNRIVTLYDALARPKQRTNQDYTLMHWTYTGPMVVFEDEAHNQTSRTVDALGRLTDVHEDSNGSNLATHYAYDALGRVTDVEQYGVAGEVPRVRHFSYDMLSRLITSTNPETGTVCYGTWSGGSCTGGYDANSNLLYKTDARNITTAYSYDSLNRLTTVASNDIVHNDYYDYYYIGVPAGSVSRLYVYDDPTPGNNGIGRLSLSASVNTGSYVYQDGQIYNGAEEYTYDAVGRTTSVANYSPDDNAFMPPFSVQYDLAGNPKTFTYPSGRILTQTWDGAGQLTGIIDQGNGTNYLSSAVYAPSGAVAAMTFGNQVTESISYNNRLQECESTITSGFRGVAATIYQKQIFYGSENLCGSAFENNGNVKAIVDPLAVGLTQSFNYDALDRLTSVSRADGAYNYNYVLDSFGNMQMVSNLTGNPNVSYNAKNQVDIGGSYIYDSTGNLTNTGPQWLGGHQFLYDAANQILNVDNGSMSYLYDADGQRTVKYTSAAWTAYARFGGQVMSENVTDDHYNDFVYANGRRIASIDGDPKAINIQGSAGAVCNWHLPLPAGGIRSGDVLAWKETHATDVQSILTIDSTNYDREYFSGGMSTDGEWHDVQVGVGGGSLTNPSLTMSWIQAGSLESGGFSSAPGSSWYSFITNISLVRADGTVYVMYGGTSSAGSAGLPSCSTGTSVSVGSTWDRTPIANTHYYVGDHLNTAQLTLSTSGAPEWRGDFLPYGGEVDTNSTTNNYKFTGKERDAESGLDYFGARYYASSMGRMMSPDWSAKAEPVPYAKLDDPQSLNLYSYVRNNPLSRTDPDGHYDCSGNECKKLKGALKDIDKASNSKKLTADQRATLKAVVAFYGKAGDHNGVTVNTGDAAVGANGGTHTDADGKTTISLKLANWDSKGLSGASARAEKDGTVAHEGVHGVQQKDHGMPQSPQAEYLGELQSYAIQGAINQARGVDSAYGIWTQGGGFNQGQVQKYADKSTDSFCGGCWNPARQEEPQQ